MAALLGGGIKAKPGEVSLAHHGVLLLDELPEFSSHVLDSLRHPLEAGEAVIARANQHVRYPARFQLISAMNPRRCGGGPGVAACTRGPRSAQDYQARISGPFLDRIDLFYETPPVTAVDLSLPAPSEGTAEVRERVARARELQAERFDAGTEGRRLINADMPPRALDQFALPDRPGAALLSDGAAKLSLTALGYTRVLKVARTIADLDGSTGVRRVHVAEALSYRHRPASSTASTAGSAFAR